MNQPLISLFKFDAKPQALAVPFAILMTLMCFGLLAEELPDKKYYLFGKGGGKTIADEYNIPLLAQIPIIDDIRTGGDEGKPAVVDGSQTSRDAFNQMSQSVAQQVAIRNAEMEPTKKVAITQS
ncbi:MAG: P-loop NTPase, partial [Bacteroidetes bacterium]|nr:P-loop NTPase [Bacteroidota bacterium]